MTFVLPIIIQVTLLLLTGRCFQHAIALDTFFNCLRKLCPRSHIIVPIKKMYPENKCFFQVNSRRTRTACKKGLVLKTEIYRTVSVAKKPANETYQNLVLQLNSKFPSLI